MEVMVRKATNDDYSALCELFDEIDALHRDNLPRIFREPSGAAREQEYLGLLANENTAFFVATVDEKLVGFLQAVVRDAPAMPVFVPRRYVIVDSVAVRSGYKHHGIGSILMEEAQEWALANGATSIELNVYEFNESAIAFYEKLGYRTFSRKMSKELITGKVG